MPAYKFTPICDREADHTKAPDLRALPQRESNFERRLEKMAQKLHQGNQEKLLVLQMCHKYKQENLQKRLLQFEFTEPSNLTYLRKEHALALDKFIRCIEDCKFDCELDTLNMIKAKQK